MNNKLNQVSPKKRLLLLWLKGYSANFYFWMEAFFTVKRLICKLKNIEVLELNQLIIVIIFKCQIIDIWMKIMYYNAFKRKHKFLKNSFTLTGVFFWKTGNFSYCWKQILLCIWINIGLKLVKVWKWFMKNSSLKQLWFFLV